MVHSAPDLQNPQVTLSVPSGRCARGTVVVAVTSLEVLQLTRQCPQYLLLSAHENVDIRQT